MSRFLTFTKKVPRLFLAIAILLFSALPLKAVVIAGPDPNATTSAPMDDPGWGNVGRGQYSCVYLGNGWVLTCQHDRLPDSSELITFNGQNYFTAEIGSSIQLNQPPGDPAGTADLSLFRLNSMPPGLASLAISSSTNSTFDGNTIMTGIGYGLDRATNLTTWNSAWVEGGIPTMYSGYKLFSTYNTKRWGQNKFYQQTILDLGLGKNHVIQLNFDQPESPNSMGDYEFQGAKGDSGGGLFVKDSNNVWNLAGILHAAGKLAGQPSQTAVYGDNTYAIDLSFYRDQIVAAVQVFQFSNMMSNPTATMGSGWQSVQLVENGGFGSALGSWSTPIDTNGFAFTVDSGTNTVSIGPTAGIATGVISGSGGLTKSGSGTLILSAANVFSGSTKITAGTLKLSNADALQNSKLIFTAGALTFDSSIAAFTLGGLSGSKTITLKDTANNPITLAVGNNGQDTTFSGAIDGSGSFAKIGSGTLSLTGPLSYSGDTTVWGGTLTVSNLNAPNATIAVYGANSMLNATSIVADKLSIGSDGGASSFSFTRAPQFFNTVPEPGTKTLILLGMFALGAVRLGRGLWKSGVSCAGTKP